MSGQHFLRISSMLAVVQVLQIITSAICLKIPKKFLNISTVVDPQFLSHSFQFKSIGSQKWRVFKLSSFWIMFGYISFHEQSIEIKDDVHFDLVEIQNKISPSRVVWQNLLNFGASNLFLVFLYFIWCCICILLSYCVFNLLIWFLNITNQAKFCIRQVICLTNLNQIDVLTFLKYT